MTKEVILTPLARRDFEQVISYLMENSGLNAVNDCVKRFEKVIDLLSTNADLYLFYDVKRNLQKLRFNKT